MTRVANTVLKAPRTTVLVRGQAVPAPGVGQDGLVGAHPGHAVFVDGQEQGVLAVGPFV